MVSSRQVYCQSLARSHTRAWIENSRRGMPVVVDDVDDDTVVVVAVVVLDVADVRVAVVVDCVLVDVVRDVAVGVVVFVAVAVVLDAVVDVEVRVVDVVVLAVEVLVLVLVRVVAVEVVVVVAVVVVRVDVSVDEVAVEVEVTEDVVVVVRAIHAPSTHTHSAVPHTVPQSTPLGTELARHPPDARSHVPTAHTFVSPLQSTGVAVEHTARPRMTLHCPARSHAVAGQTTSAHGSNTVVEVAVEVTSGWLSRAVKRWRPACTTHPVSVPVAPNASACRCPTHSWHAGPGCGQSVMRRARKRVPTTPLSTRSVADGKATATTTR